MDFLFIELTLITTDTIEKNEVESSTSTTKTESTTSTSKVQSSTSSYGKVWVRGHYRTVNGKRVYVRGHYRSKPRR